MATAADRVDRRFAGAAVRTGVRAFPCLLYTSDAADERSSVDLGGRRIIKKKNCRRIGRGGDIIENGRAT